MAQNCVRELKNILVWFEFLKWLIRSPSESIQQNWLDLRSPYFKLIYFYIHSKIYLHSSRRRKVLKEKCFLFLIEARKKSLFEIRYIFNSLDTFSSSDCTFCLCLLTGVLLKTCFSHSWQRLEQINLFEGKNDEWDFFARIY